MRSPLRVGLTLVGSVIFLACSSKSPAVDASAPTTTTAPTVTSPAGEDVVGGSGDDAASAPDASAADVPNEDAPGDETKDELARRLEAIGRLEVDGMTRNRSHVQGELATVQLDTAANERGATGAVELTVSVCEPCVATTVADLEGRKEMLLQQLGELHAKNEGLVFTVKPLELAPARTGAMVYARSYVDDGTTRASVHTLETFFADNGFALRFQAYPRSGFPTSADELASLFTQAELEAATRAVFAAAQAILWPPAPQ